MLKNAKRKLAALLAIMLVILSMLTEAVMAAENDGLPITNETTAITDDLVTDENVETEESVPPEASETEENGTDVKPSESTMSSESEGNEIVEDGTDVQETLMPDETGNGENVEETDSAEIAEMIYAQLTADDFEALVTKVEDAYMGMEEDSAGELDTEKLLFLIQNEVADCLADILEKAKEDYADLAKEDVYQEVYNSLYEKVLNNITELLGLNQQDNENNSSAYSLLPLTEKKITPDLTGLTPVELTMVPFSRIFQGEDMAGVVQIAYVCHDSTYEWSDSYADDYEIGNYLGTVNLSCKTSGSYNDPWLMIPGGNQLNNDATRYIVKPQYTVSNRWLVPSIYVQDDSGNRSEVVASSYEYYDYNPQSRDISIDVPAWETSAKAYLKFDINKSLYGDSNNRAVVKVYEGYYDTAEEAQSGNDITDKIYGNIDMTISNSGYPISGYYSGSKITIVTFDERGNVTGCLPLKFSLYPEGNSSSNHINTGSLFKREGTAREYVHYTSRTQIKENIETKTYELYDGYAVNDAYYLTMTYYQNGTSNGNAVTAAYAGTYTSIAEAANSGAVDVKEALFGSDYNTAGYKADYSNGVYFTIFVGADGEGQEAYHYCIKTKAGIVPKSNSVGVRFTGLKDKDNKNVACYVVKPKDDSYGDGSYPTIIVADDVDLTWLAPMFYTDSGVNLYVAGGNTPEISGESYHDFSNGVVAYTTGSESKKNQKNVWLSVVKAGSVDGMTYNLYTNSLSDKDADTRIENGVIYSRREVILESKNDGHDIFLINMGENVIPNLSVELASSTLQLDEYWTLNGNHNLSAFSGTTSTANYGELANMAKVRLKMKDGVTSGEEVEGTLTVKANGTTIMVLELTGIAGVPVIVTDSIPEAVKYVPYGAMIQNSNKYSKTKIKYALDSGTLPEGMELMENGELYGVPKEAGTFYFTVKMASTDPNSSMSRSFTLVVKENTDANVDAATDIGYDVTQRIPTVAIGSTDSHIFVSQGVLGEFIDVYLDGEKLIKDVDYTAESGSTRLTIGSQTLTRDNTTGTHTLGVEFRTSNEKVLKAAAQNFNVVEAGSSTGGNNSSGGSGSSSANNDSSGSEGNVNDVSSTSNNTSTGFAATVAAGAVPEIIQNAAPIIYTVVSGDTLSKIASQYYGNASLWTKIYEDNRDIISNPNMIRVGWQIKIYPVAAGDAGLTLNQMEVNQANAGTEGSDGSIRRTYVVQSGDTLWKISKAMYGKGWQWKKIYDANRDSISNSGVIRVGQVIVIP